MKPQGTLNRNMAVSIYQRCCQVRGRGLLKELLMLSTLSISPSVGDLIGRWEQFVQVLNAGRRFADDDHLFCNLEACIGWLGCFCSSFSYIYFSFNLATTCSCSLSQLASQISFALIIPPLTYDEHTSPKGIVYLVWFINYWNYLESFSWKEDFVE